VSTQFFRSGGVTVQIQGVDEAVRAALTRVENATLSAVETIVDTVAESARAEWYTHVDRETGKSGDITSRVTIDADGSQIHGQIVARDDRRGLMASGRGVPVPLLVHTSGYSRASTKKQVSHEEYWRTPKDRQGRYHPSDIDKAEGITGPFIWTGPAPVKSTTGDAGAFTTVARGFYLAQRLVIGPARAMVKQLPTEIRHNFARNRRPRKAHNG